MPSTFLFDGESDGFCQKSIYTTRRGKYQSKIRYDIHLLRPKDKKEKTHFSEVALHEFSSFYAGCFQGNLLVAPVGAPAA